MTTTANGRAERKSLAEQIDRLDLILDGLAEGLNAAVALAVKEAVSRAVDAVLTEVLTNAELRRQPRGGQTPKAGTVRGAARWLWSGLVGAAACCRDLAVRAAMASRQTATQAVVILSEGGKVVVRRARRGLSASARRVWAGGVMAVALARRVLRPLLVALAVGAVVVLGCYLARPGVASLVSGFAGSLLAGVVNRLRRLPRRDKLSAWCMGRVR